MSDSPDEGADGTAPEFETSESDGTDTSVARVLAAIAAGSLLTGAVAWTVVEVGNLAMGTTAGVGLGVAVGGGLGAVAYLMSDTVTNGDASTHSTDGDDRTQSTDGDARTQTTEGESPTRYSEEGPDERTLTGTGDAKAEGPGAETGRPATERRVASESATPDRASASETNGSDLFATHPDPVLSFAGEGEDLRVTDANAAFETVFGASGSMLAGTPLGEAAMTDDAADIAERIARGEPVDESVTCETVDGSDTFRLRAVTHADERDGIRGYLLYTETTGGESDRTEDRVAELASVVSHELSNPLYSAQTRIRAARDSGEDEHFETALRNIDRAFRIIEDLTTLARGGTLVEDRESVALDEAVSSSWETIDAESATLSVVGELGPVRADDSALEHLLENLFRNAVDHASEHVTVEVGRLDDGFYVADDGPGIPSEQRADVFEAGYTTDREGTGLGLNIVDRVADAHGWTVTITESDDGGARFEITGVERPE